MSPASQSCRVRNQPHLACYGAEVLVRPGGAVVDGRAARRRRSRAGNSGKQKKREASRRRGRWPGPSGLSRFAHVKPQGGWQGAGFAGQEAVHEEEHVVGRGAVGLGHVGARACPAGDEAGDEELDVIGVATAVAGEVAGAGAGDAYGPKAADEFERAAGHRAPARLGVVPTDRARDFVHAAGAAGVLGGALVHIWGAVS